MFSLFHSNGVHCAEKLYDDEDEQWIRMEEGRAGHSLNCAPNARCHETKDMSTMRQERRQSVQVIQLVVVSNELDKDTCKTRQNSRLHENRVDSVPIVLSTGALNDRRKDAAICDTKAKDATNIETPMPQAKAPRLIRACAPPVGTRLEVQCEDDQWHGALVRKSVGAKATIVFDDLEDGQEAFEELVFPYDNEIVRILKPENDMGASMLRTVDSVSELEVESLDEEERILKRTTEVDASTAKTVSGVSDVNAEDEEDSDEDSDEEDDEAEDSDQEDEEVEDSDEENESDDEEACAIERGSVDVIDTQKDNSVSKDDDEASTAAGESCGDCGASDLSWAPSDHYDDEHARLCARQAQEDFEAYS